MLGREFRRDVLEAVWTGSAGELAAGLARLIEAEFIYPAGADLGQRYVFKHALIQDAAYEALLKSHRATHHRRIAQVLEDRFPALVEDQPEIVARHYALGGHPERAAHFWLRSGQRALTRNAHVEAAAHLRSALAAVGELPESTAKAVAELDVQIALGTALVAARGYASPDVETAWRRAQQLCAVVGNAPQLVPALFGLWMFETVRANHPAGAGAVGDHRADGASRAERRPADRGAPRHGDLAFLPRRLRRREQQLRHPAVDLRCGAPRRPPLPVRPGSGGDRAHLPGLDPLAARRHRARRRRDGAGDRTSRARWSIRSRCRSSSHGTAGCASTPAKASAHARSATS